MKKTVADEKLNALWGRVETMLAAEAPNVSAEVKFRHPGQGSAKLVWRRDGDPKGRGLYIDPGHGQQAIPIAEAARPRRVLAVYALDRLHKEIREQQEKLAMYMQGAIDFLEAWVSPPEVEVEPDSDDV